MKYEANEASTTKITAVEMKDFDPSTLTTGFAGLVASELLSTDVLLLFALADEALLCFTLLAVAFLEIDEEDDFFVTFLVVFVFALDLLLVAIGLV